MAAPRVIVATDLPAWERNTGATQRICAMVDALHAAGFEMHLFHPAHAGRRARALAAGAMPGVPLHTPPLPLLALRGLRRRVMPAGDAGPLSPPYRWERRAAFRAVCARLRPAAVLVNYARLAYLVEGLRGAGAAAPHTVLDAHDVLSRRSESLAAAGQTPAEPVSEADERAAFACFDSLIAIQPEEAALMRAWFPRARVLVAGHPAAPRALPHPAEDGMCTLLYVGAGGAHNAVNLQWLLDAAWPRIRARFGARVRLRVVGRAGEAIAPAGGVETAGYVDDLAGEYARAHLVINPCIAGSGLKIKNVEALGFGRALLTTPLGAEGIDLATNPCAVADAGAFAEAAMALLGDAARRTALEASALAYARARLTPEAVFADLIALLRALPH